MTRILAFTGKMGSGKSTAIEIIKAHLNREVHLVKFAQPLYDMQQFIYERIGREQPKPKDRKLLQWLGTEWGRGIDENLWGKIWQKQVDVLLERSPTSLIVCDDCRFDNEALRVKNNGGKIVRVVTSDDKRGERIQLENTGHSSEAGVNDNFVDFVLKNDGTQEELEANVKEMLRYL